MTVVLGLTGSIGTGKSTVTRQFAQLGAKTLNADHIVHHLLAKKGAAVEAVAKAFPKAHENGAINRQVLGKLVFGDDKALKKLEAMLHPLVVQAEEEFVSHMKRKRARLVVLDIPLLFETKAHGCFDAVVVTTCPPLLQRQRVLRRKHMSEEKFTQILARQMSDAEKCRRADFIVQTGLGRDYSMRAVKEIMEAVCAA